MCVWSQALSGLLGGSTDSQSSENPDSTSPTSPHTASSLPLSSCPTSSGADKSLLSPEPSLVSPHSPSPVLSRLLESNLQSVQTPRDQDQSASLPASLTPGSEGIKTEDQDAPHPHLSGPSHDSESTACLSDPAPPPASSPSPNVACLFSAPIATQSDSSSGNRESKQAELASRGNSLSDSSPSSHPFSTPDRSCPPSPEFQPEVKSLSSDEISLSYPLKEEDTINPSAPVLSSESEEVCPTSPSPKPSSPVCQFSPQCQDGEVDGAVERIPGLSEHSQQVTASHDDNLHPAPPVQDVFQRNHLPFGFEDTHRTGGQGGEEGADTVQTPEVYSSAGLSASSRLVSEEVCNQTEIDPQLQSCSLQEELSAGSKPEESQRGSDRESVTSVSPDGVPEAHSRPEVEPKGLIKVQSLDLVFQSSVDGSGSESDDREAFLERLDNEGRVYWAEPIQLSNPTPEAGSFETPDESPGNTNAAFSSPGRDMASSVTSSTTTDTNQTSTNATSSSDSPSSLTRPLASPVAPSNLKPSSRSVSVQMSSSPSSHIVHRTDVPFTTHSKRSPLPSVLPLDTSSPFRAVQSWTDLHIQRHTLTQELSHGGLHSAPYEVTVSTGMIPNPTPNFSSSPYVPKEWESHDYLPGMARNPMSVSVDKGLWTDEEEEEEEVDRNGGEYEDKLWESPHTETIACCSSCDQQCTCGHGEQRGNIPVSIPIISHRTFSPPIYILC